MVLDTNVYGEMIKEGVAQALADRLLAFRNTLVIYGLPEIRTELRSAPRFLGIGGKNLRIALLEAYDVITEGRVLEDRKAAERLAQRYYEAYRESDGHRSWKDMRIDLLIIAKATLLGIDVVTSEDRTTMRSAPALAAYAAVNKESSLITPFFYTYQMFKDLLL